MENYYGGDRGTAAQPQPPSSMHDLRSYSTSHATNYAQPAEKEVKMKKSKSRVVASSSSSKSWSFADPELQRKKRIVSYKAYAMEGKMKGTFRKSFRWIKDTCNHVVHGWW